MTGVTFSPDGRRLAVTTQNDRVAMLLDSETGRTLLKLRGPNGPTHAASFSPDNRHLATAHGVGVVVWETSDDPDRLTLRGHTSQVNSVAFRPDGHALASGSPMVPWDLGPNHRAADAPDVGLGRSQSQYRRRYLGGRLQPGRDVPRLGPLRPGPPGLDSRDRPGLVKLGARTDSLRRDIQPGRYASGLGGRKLLPDGSVGRGQDTGSLPPAGNSSPCADSGRGLHALHTTHDGSRVVAVSQTLDRTRALRSPGSHGWAFGTPSPANILAYEKPFAASRPALSRDGRLLIIAGTIAARPHDLGEVKAWDILSGRVTFSLKGDLRDEQFALTPDGRRLVAGGADVSGRLKLWDTQTGLEVLSLRGIPEDRPGDQPGREPPGTGLRFRDHRLRFDGGTGVTVNSEAQLDGNRPAEKGSHKPRAESEPRWCGP